MTPTSELQTLTDESGFIRTRIKPGDEGQVFLDRLGHMALIVIDGPNDLNPMSASMYREMYANLEEFRDDEELWVAILCGAGERAFSAGGDLKKAMAWATPPIDEQMRYFWYPRNDKPMLTSRISIDVFSFEVYKPIIAAISGHCLGAAAIIAIALADLRIAGEGSSIGFAEARRGLAGAAGGSGISRSVPLAWAMWMCLTGESIDAVKGSEIGLFNEVVPANQVVARAVAIGEQLCAISPVVLRVEKELLLRSYDMPRQELLRLKWVLAQVQKMGHDALEGQRAFQEKRDPVFEGW
jgi:enoyl-CoA hydratase/carnithine racemase